MGKLASENLIWGVLSRGRLRVLLLPLLPSVQRSSSGGGPPARPPPGISSLMLACGFSGQSSAGLAQLLGTHCPRKPGDLVWANSEEGPYAVQ